MKRIVVVSFVILAIVLVAASTVFARSDRIKVCHKLGNGEFNQITIDDDALEGHLGHGDVYPVPSEGCESLNNQPDPDPTDEPDPDPTEEPTSEPDPTSEPTSEPIATEVGTACANPGNLWPLASDAEGNRYVGTNLPGVNLMVSTLEYGPDGTPRLHQPYLGEITPFGPGSFKIPAEFIGQDLWFAIGDCGAPHGSQFLGLD